MSIVKNSPDMNITNQINAALNDVRTTMIDMATSPTVNDATLLFKQIKAQYQLYLALTMITEHRQGKSISWSDRKPQVEEEFS